MEKLTMVSLVIVATFTLSFAETPQSIPYPKALNTAAVSVKRLDSILDYALIIGNGDINALVYQEENKVVMRITKNDVWDARLFTENDPSLPSLALLKQLGEGDWPNRKWIIPKDYIITGPDSYHQPVAYPCPRVCAIIEFQLPPAPTPASPTPRLSAALDIHYAVARIYSANPEKPIITIRALSLANVFLVQTACDAELKAVSTKELPPAVVKTENTTTTIHQTIPGDPDWPGMEFAVALEQGKTIKTIAVTTSLESNPPVDNALALARNILAQPLDQLIRRHQDDWLQFWSAGGIDIDDPILQNSWYRNLYFLRCVSKPGVVSTGLFAGLIDDVPEWHGDYHTNYNIQQTFWGCFTANHVELIEPYIQLIHAYLPRAKWLAKQVFNSKGGYYPHVLFAYEPSDPEQCRSHNSRQYIHHVWGMTIGVAGFTVQPLWWAYKYQPDRDILENYVYPPLREVTQFYLDFMDQCDRNSDGRIILAPSVSPEHRGWTERFEYNRNCAFDIAMIRYCLQATIEAAATLNRDEQLAKQCTKYLALLPDYPVNTTERNLPFVVDVQDATAIEYNIAVPATPVFPCDVVTWFSPARQKDLFARTIRDLQWNGNNSTVMLGVARARLSMPYADEWIRDEILQRLRPNGTLRLNRGDARFNDFGHYTEQFGITMAVSELLLQSVADVIRLFPAWPPNKPARFHQLRTQGGFLVSAERNEKQITRLEILSTAGGRCRVENPWPRRTITCRKNEQTLTLSEDNSGILSLDTQPGERLVFQTSP